MSNTKSNKHYHHGNLKEALIEGFLELLADTPVDKLSLRKLASHVGVAPTAVYNHFSNAEEMRVAVKIKCLGHFADFLDNAVVEIEDPEDRIRALGKNYFYYSIKHPQYFEFLMGENIPPELITEDVIATSMRAECALRAAVVDLLKKHKIPTCQYNEGLGSFACWSIAHGITTLAAKHVNTAACKEGRWPEEFMMSNPEQVEQSFDAMSDVLIAGILAAARK